MEAEMDSRATEEFEKSISRTLVNSTSANVPIYVKKLSLSFDSDSEIIPAVIDNNEDSEDRRKSSGRLTGRLNAVASSFTEEILTPIKQRFFEHQNFHMESEGEKFRKGIKFILHNNTLFRLVNIAVFFFFFK